MMKWCHVTLESEANACKSKPNSELKNPLQKITIAKSINAAKNPFRKNAIFVLANPIATTTVAAATKKQQKGGDILTAAVIGGLLIVSWMATSDSFCRCGNQRHLIDLRRCLLNFDSKA